MSRMGETERRLWRDRLTHAHQFWQDEGLTGDREDNDQRFTIATIGAAYRGVQWQGSWGGLSGDELVTVNLMFSSTNTLLAGLSARAAKPIVKPKGQDLASDDASRRAALNEVLLGSVATDLKMKRQVDMAVLDASLFPAGFVQHIYVPLREKYTKEGRMLEVYDPARPDFPTIRRRRISDVRVDPLASSLYPDEDARWVAFRDLYFLSEMKLHPGFTNRKDLHATYRIGDDKTKPGSLQRDGGPEERELVEVWTIYDKVERKWFAISPGCEQPVREPDDWPISWDSLPYDVVFFNPRPDSIIPVSLPEIYYDIQMEINKVRTMMSALVKRMRYAIVANEQAMGEGELEKLVDGDLVEFFRTTGADPRSVVQSIKLGEFPQELLMYYALCKTDLQEVLGISSMDRAQRINVETATEANNVQQGSNVLRSRGQEKVEEFWGNIFRKLHRGIQQTQTDDILLPIFDKQAISQLQGVGASVSQNSVKIQPNDLQGEFHYGVQVGSTLPEDPESELRRNIALFQLFKDDALVNQRDLRHGVLVGARKDADRMLATAGAEQGANLNDLGMMGVGRSLAAAEKPQSGEATNPGGNGSMPPEMMQMLSAKGGMGVPS